MKSKLPIVLAVAALLLGIAMMNYHNHAVALDERVNASWSQVLNQYKRRADLVPNLVNTVKGYAAHEKELFVAVTQARAEAGKVQLTPGMLNDPLAFAAFEKHQNALSSALSRLLVVAERYPELKADRNFAALQSQLEGTENRIAVARRDYIESVRNFNTMIRRVPEKYLLFVTDPELAPRPTFTVPESETGVPEVAF